MSESITPILVDTNVLFDVLHDDPLWAEWSKQQLEIYAEGLTINPLIYTELSYQASTKKEVDRLVKAFGLQFAELPRAALFHAAKAFYQYRQRGGVKTAPLADFFIGAHAHVAKLPILTRDEGRYRTYFPKVVLVSPVKS